MTVLLFHKRPRPDWMAWVLWLLLTGVAAAQGPASESAGPSLLLDLPEPCRVDGAESLAGSWEQPAPFHRVLTFQTRDDSLSCALDGLPGKQLVLRLEQVVVPALPSSVRTQPVATASWWLRATLDGRPLRGRAAASTWEKNVLLVHLRGVAEPLHLSGQLAWRETRPAPAPIEPTEAQLRERERLSREMQARVYLFHARGCVDELRAELRRVGLLERFDRAKGDREIWILRSKTTQSFMATLPEFMEYRRAAPDCMDIDQDINWVPPGEEDLY